MSLVTLKNITVGFGGQNLLENVEFTVSPGDRIGLMGQNGSGKSTILKIIAGILKPDSGEIMTSSEFSASYLNQEVPELQGSVYENIAEAFPDSEILSKYFLSQTAPGEIKDFGDIQIKMNEKHLWETDAFIKETADKLDLDYRQDASKLSGGYKRKVILARSLVRRTSLLLLDEPTNHLDIPSIVKLEEIIGKYAGAVLFVTHDRAFLRKTATRILEIDRGSVISWDMSWDRYLERRENMMESEKAHLERFQKKIKREEQWLHRGISARRTRNEGRLRNLLEMREEWKKRRLQRQNPAFSFEQSASAGKIAFQCKDISFSRGEKKIISDFTTVITKGEKIGIIGANGSGKTTLLRIFCGDLKPDTGTVKTGTNLDIVYFDQLRSTIEPEKTLRENISGGPDMVRVRGELKHVISYLKEFMFRPEQVDSPVNILSGGELARLVLAKLFLQSANVLVFDEPTNDLDIETLEHLENLCVTFEGTVLLVSHDREFLNNVAAAVFYLDGTGNIIETAGGYDDVSRLSIPKEEKKAEKKIVEKKSREKTKRSFKEEQEYAVLPGLISDLEEQKNEIIKTLEDPEFYIKRSSEIHELTAHLTEIDEKLNNAYEKWMELSEYDR